MSVACQLRLIIAWGLASCLKCLFSCLEPTGYVRVIHLKLSSVHSHTNTSLILILCSSYQPSLRETCFVFDAEQEDAANVAV